MRRGGELLSLMAVLFLTAANSFGQPVQPGVDETIVRRLIDGLKDPDPEVRQNLGAALAKVGTPAVEPLIAALKDSLSERRSGAAYALALIGPTARAALPALLDTLEDKDVEVRRQASYAISRLIPPGRPVAGGGGVVVRPSVPPAVSGGFR